MEPLVLRPRDQETAGSGDENVVANGIWNVWTVFIAGLQPRDKASTLVHKTIQFFFENLYEQRVSSHRKKTLTPTRSPSSQLQGKAAILSTTLLISFPAENGPDLRLLYCQMHECEHPELSDWRYS